MVKITILDGAVTVEATISAEAENAMRAFIADQPGKYQGVADLMVQHFRESLTVPLVQKYSTQVKAAQDAGSKRVMANEKIGNALVTTMVLPLEGFTLKAYLDDKAMITRVHTVGGGRLGKSVVEFLYSDYKDVDTIAPPTGPKMVPMPPT